MTAARSSRRSTCPRSNGRPDISITYTQGGPDIPATDLAEADALILLGLRLSRANLEPGGSLALVARFGVGYDFGDVGACTENGVALDIVPDAVRRPVATTISPSPGLDQPPTG